MPPNNQYPPTTPMMGPLPPNPPVSMHSVKKHSWGLIVALVVFVLLTLGFGVFGIWAYSSQQDYKNNSDKKAAQAAAVAVQKETTRKDNEFIEKEKQPLKKFEGPAEYGNLSVSYPKTWGAYIVVTDKSAVPVDGYFHPNYVPGVQSGTAFALRIQVSSQLYDQEMKQFESKAKSGKVTVKPYALKNVPGVTGARVDGEINTGQKNTMILLPLRDRTIKVSTEAPQYIGDFDNIILANLKFIP